MVNWVSRKIGKLVGYVKRWLKLDSMHAVDTLFKFHGFIGFQ